MRKVMPELLAQHLREEQISPSLRNHASSAVRKGILSTKILPTRSLLVPVSSVRRKHVKTVANQPRSLQSRLRPSVIVSDTSSGSTSDLLILANSPETLRKTS